MMKNSKLIRGLSPLAAISAIACSAEKTPERPNILLIVADDLGMGDLNAYSPYNAQAPGRHTIPTPRIDSLSQQSLLFCNAYSTSATSTPSRYGLFTGMYPWKNPRAEILDGDAPLLIPADMPTLPKMLQAAGYATGAIGKWHLGMGDGDTNWNEPISPSANTVGFDYTCVIAATNDRVPTVYVENGLVMGLDENDPIEVNYKENFPGEPTALSNPEMLKMEWDHGHNCSIVNGIPRIGYMKGGQTARWVDEDMADFFAGQVKAFIDEHTDEPFFLYYGLHEPHVPRTPHSRFAGKTTLGPRGDAVAEADWCVGEVLDYLQSKGLLENTIVIVTSDNGPVLNDGYKDKAVEMLGEHNPYNGTRGGKYSLFDGGTHIPFMIYWEGKVVPGISEAFFSQMDLFASLADILSLEVPEGIDSENHSDVLLGKSDKGRTSQVLEAAKRLAFYEDGYELIPPYRGAARNITGNELGNLPAWSLFNVLEDPAQTQDLAAEEPEKVENMRATFLSIIGDKWESHPAAIIEPQD